MADYAHNSGARKTERFFLLVLSIVMLVLFYQLFRVLAADFADVPRRQANGTMINLNDDKPGERIKTLLHKGFYFKDPKDVNLISKVVASVSQNRNAPLDNVGELNKSNYN